MPKYRTIASVLRVRENPNTNAAIIGRLPLNTGLDLMEDNAKGWARVKANLQDGKMTGWVSMAYIEPLGETAPTQEPEWLTIARAEIGVKEYPGAQHNPRIIEYLKATTNQATSDETAWCSGFVNWCMKQAGVERTNNAMARSWLKWGKALKEPEHGCVTIFDRSDPANPNAGHVAFYLETRGTGIQVLGGNQGNCVSITSYPASRVLGYRGKA